ncbi:hypothetical protein O6H91_17G017700 [Diphasiastrum complanatum]|uniref:Uncharacterized protein n=2 Tax=Diphasiastrum complanatum TaxID=34168 RepID=A0ACC2B5P1_DIPCM|nr:hypothetical protein O6H91_17G017700 [Diphasiastrum complanatum]KAJ7524709.1 hypothetical protein O6H91_17G017700 [Diphasiastrum complanatum]
MGNEQNYIPAANHLKEREKIVIEIKRRLSCTRAESLKAAIEDTNVSNPSTSPKASHQFTAISCKEEKGESTSSNSEGELLRLKAAHSLSNLNRRLALIKFFDLRGNINVFCRIRPPSPDELEESTVVRHLKQLEDEIEIITAGKMKKTYQFDRIFGPSSSQDDVYSEVEPIIRSALDGSNVCIFSYGQTGTGKTFTMEGNDSNPGIIPRAFQWLFYEASTESSVKYTFTLSMLEVYRGSLRDLLVTRYRGETDPHAKSLHIQMAGPSIEVENLTKINIISANHANFLYQRATGVRSTSSTTANDTSSRSHSLARISITRTCPHDKESTSTSKLWLIDLAGSERYTKTKAHGRTLEEGKFINVSLCALADVISALQSKQPHIPYRNSKLTQLLRDCLGMDSKTLLLVHISPREDDVGETICSLDFSSRARGVHLGKELSEVAAMEKAATRACVLRKMKAYEAECRRLSDKIHAIETVLKQKIESVSVHEQDPDKSDRNGDPADLEPLKNTMLPRENTVRRHVYALPRFMSSTVSSRGKKRLNLDNMDHRFFASHFPHEAGKDENQKGYSTKYKS